MYFEYLDEKGRRLGPELRLAITTAMTQLENSQDKLIKAVQADRNYPIWVYDTHEEEKPRHILIGALRLLDYQPGQGGTDSLLFPALVGSSKHTLNCVQDVNSARTRLALVLKQSRGINVLVQDRDTGDMIKRQWLRVVLSMLGHSRLNQRQATRAFRCFEKTPSQVSYSWVNLRKVSYTTVKEVRQEYEEKISKQAGELSKSTEVDYEKLTSLELEEPLAIVTPLREQVRANVAWSDSNHPVVKRAQFYASAPIFYPSRHKGALPRLRKLPEKDAPRSFRLQRSDLKLESEPLIAKQRIYRYRTEYREEARRAASERLESN
ncbi:MAG: hypothetical protein GY807_08655 [Gammaproteobacteria bacterium]|nr:hypothetical protein [Gammaproteobacteria bacterium]